MKILMAGGGTGGHFYPIVAVAHALRELAEKERIARLDLILMSDTPYDENILRQEEIIFEKSPAGKLRRYFSFKNFSDIFKTFFGILRTLWKMFLDMPDAIFAKGGYASFPTLVAARVFRIPVLLHESDAIPGLVNRWAGKFAKKIAVSFQESALYFPKDKTALLGNPIRKRVISGNADAARRVFGLEKNIKTILILGGSQGSQKINDTVLAILPSLVENYNVIHQCGKLNYEEVNQRTPVILKDSSFAKRYYPTPFLAEGDLGDLSRTADLVVSRAGAGAIFEIAAWGLPSILIPLDNSAGDHQRKNAYIYVKKGAAAIIEEKNLKPHIFLFEIEKLLRDEEKIKKMKIAARDFAKIDAAEKIARELMNMALEHAQ
ncbi:MAG: undecaprenyldiphospho-muramoylpentapeptide beta-N-acetylglucosaminyltransferase [Patescibacteria group bacterium]